MVVESFWGSTRSSCLSSQVGGKGRKGQGGCGCVFVVRPVLRRPRVYSLAVVVGEVSSGGGDDRRKRGGHRPARRPLAVLSPTRDPDPEPCAWSARHGSARRRPPKQARSLCPVRARSRSLSRDDELPRRHPPARRRRRTRDVKIQGPRAAPSYTRHLRHTSSSNLQHPATNTYLPQPPRVSLLKFLETRVSFSPPRAIL